MIENRISLKAIYRSTITHAINIEFTGSPFPIIYHTLVEKERFLCV